jgi:hypothetical protein
MMKSLLLLGAVLFGAEAESQEIQKLLAYARGLENIGESGTCRSHGNLEHSEHTSQKHVITSQSLNSS